jgi:hypothetical protein
MLPVAPGLECGDFGIYINMAHALAQGKGLRLTYLPTEPVYPIVPVGYPLVLTQLIAITPGGLGVREGIVAIVASVYGIEMGVSVLAVGIDRLVATSVILVLGTVFTYILSKKAANTPVIEGGEG